MAGKHINIPIFVPFMGCPNKCVFCDQRAISGVSFFSREEAEETIRKHLATAPADSEREIAFFGGSFTGIERGLMTGLLDMAEGYVSRGLVRGIRMSTRPDYIDPEVIAVLSRYTVTAVELGVQSISDRVLAISKRGHTAKDTETAFSLLRDAGIPSVGQMMIGLPGSTGEDETATARAISDAGAVASRIYPAVVFENTELCAMMRRGEYGPLTVEDAVGRSADALEVFAARGVKCLRVGLYGADGLASSGSAVAGPLHPAFGELVVSECYKRAIERRMEGVPRGSAVTVSVPRGDISAAVGQKGSVREYFCRKYGLKKMDFLENDSVLRYNIKVSFL